ncbi:MAG: hypothetical protein MJZ38_01525 [archaeon]|nr:hypothetical protein [archaeon]
MLGKVKKTVTRQDSVEEVEPVIEQAVPVKRFDDSVFEVHKVETESHEVVGIKVSKVPDTLYFEEEAPYAPTVVQVARAPVSEPVFAEPAKKENVAAAEPADLFINALRRPTRQKFDASEPRIKKKAVEAAPVVETPVMAPVIEEVKAEPAPVEVPAIVVEQVEPQSITIEVAEEFVPEVVDVPVAEAEPAPVVVETPVEVEPVVIETPVIEAEPAPVEVIEIETPVEAVPVVEEVKAEPAPVEIKAEVATVEVIELEPIAVDAPVIEAEPAPVVEPVVIETPVEAVPVAAAEPAPVIAVPSLPMKIEVPELVKEEHEESVFTDNVTSADCVLTSTDGAVVEEEVQEVLPIKEEKVLAPVIINADRDVLMLFRSELEDEEKMMSLTSMDNNSDLPEDYLDETELTFKIKVPRQFNGFTGHFRPIGFF